MAFTSRVVRKVLMGILVFIVFANVVLGIYLRFYFVGVMPRSPIPSIGRIYPVTAAYGYKVYVNKEELRYFDFVDYDLGTVSPVCMLLLYYFGVRRKWL